jgi:hypothetical protein
MGEIETQGAGRPEVNDQFKLGRLLDGQVARICAFEYL